MKTGVFLLPILSTVLLWNAFSQKDFQSASPPSQTDQFIGSWKFNSDKSSHVGIDSETIVIAARDNGYKFTFDSRGDNGTELNFWFITGMKGECVEETQVDGKPMASKACITRRDSRSFTEDDRLMKAEFKVSRDGRQLVENRRFKGRPNGRELPPAKLVFDRVAVSSAVSN